MILYCVYGSHVRWLRKGLMKKKLTNSAPLHLHTWQVTIDIFFIDWERPHGKVVVSGDAQQQKGQQASVSIWRTYFVANEWNEIQTVRKINPIFQIFAVIFFLHVVGFENWASADPHNELNPGSDDYSSEDSRIFRYAIGTLTWIVIGESHGPLQQATCHH